VPLALSESGFNSRRSSGRSRRVIDAGRPAEWQGRKGLWHDRQKCLILTSRPPGKWGSTGTIFSPGAPTVAVCGRRRQLPHTVRPSSVLQTTGRPTLPLSDLSYERPHRPPQSSAASVGGSPVTRSTTTNWRNSFARTRNRWPQAGPKAVDDELPDVASPSVCLR
jgi:hypothetical protein